MGNRPALLLALAAIAFFLVHAPTAVRSQVMSCQTDGDCREGSFCNYKMGATYCEQCRDCKRRYFRQPARSRCAKSAEECGDCQQGYVDEVTVQNGRSERCMLPRAPPPTPQPMPPPPPSLIPDIRDAEDSSDWMPWIPILLIACGIALIPVALAAYCCYANIKEQRPNSVAHATGDDPESGAAEEDESRPLQPPSYADSLARDVAVESASLAPGCSASSGVFPYRQHRFLAELPSVAAINDINDMAVAASAVTIQGEVRVEKETTQGMAEPFNRRGYAAHLHGVNRRHRDDDDGEEDIGHNNGQGELFFEGQAELAVGFGVGGLDLPDIQRPVSPANSDASNVTEPSSWHPTNAEVPNLLDIPEAETLVLHGLAEDGEEESEAEEEAGTENVFSSAQPVQPQQDDANHEDHEELFSRDIPRQSISSTASAASSFPLRTASPADSGFLTTANTIDDFSRRVSVITDDDDDDIRPPDQFAYDDSALDLRLHGMRTTRLSSPSSLFHFGQEETGQSSSTSSSRPLRRSFSNIDHSRPPGGSGGLKRRKSTQQSTDEATISKRPCETATASSEED